MPVTLVTMHVGHLGLAYAIVLVTFQYSPWWLLHCAGVEWVEMHKLAERVELEELKKCGILLGDVDDMMKVRLLLTILLHIGLSNTGQFGCHFYASRPGALHGL